MIKIEMLFDRIEELMEDGICIAFSGGVDSTLLLKIASYINRDNKCKLYAVTFHTKLHPMNDINISTDLANEMNVSHEIIEIDEFQNEEILNNTIDRCYNCKKFMFQKLVDFAKANDVKNIIDGTNFDDLSTYRPGLKALKELDIKSPLAELGIDKNTVRKWANDLDIKVANRPSAPCLATRIPYNTKIDLNLLNRIDICENEIKKMGFDVVRLRVHDEIARIEVKKDDMYRLLENSDRIIDLLKSNGFTYITIDIEGFRSGSMDVNINS
ncbi:MAG: ATP-dependent sacrificial sulfur transferase LarE [Tissierellales bacterium]|nr:ATP-dependent sacrificial sulfur transferase LarE [Tissierellales bacterium]